MTGASNSPSLKPRLHKVPPQVRSEANRELFRRDQSDQDGTFSLQQVIPGSYTVIAIENGWDLDWGKPAVLAQYIKHGQPITVFSHATGSMQVPGPVEVQPK